MAGQAHDHDRPVVLPRRSLAMWNGFVHLLARFYMNYNAAIRRAARRKKRRRVDIDVQRSIQGTLWCLHWATLGKNKLHDPHKQYNKNTRIDHLTDAELARMRGPRGQVPNRLLTLLTFANEHNVGVEVELKSVISRSIIEHLLSNEAVRELDDKHLLQFKTLAFIGAPNGPIARLRPVHEAGGTTILTFTDFKRGGISKSKAWPVTDYVRGRARWVA